MSTQPITIPTIGAVTTRIPRIMSAEISGGESTSQSAMTQMAYTAIPMPYQGISSA